MTYWISLVEPELSNLKFQFWIANRFPGNLRLGKSCVTDQQSLALTARSKIVSAVEPNWRILRG